MKKLIIGIFSSLILICGIYFGIKTKINSVKAKMTNQFIAQIDQLHFKYSYSQRSDVPIEVAIITAKKDFDSLPYCIKSVRKYLQHPITKITVVAPYSEEAIRLTRSLDVEFFDENQLLNLKEFTDHILSQKWQIGYIPEWYYQQFLKLYFYKQSKTKYYFIIDSDIVLTQPMTLVTNDGIHNFYVGKNSGHEISQISIEKILGESQYVPKFSFIADLMCFDKDIVKKLIESTELKYNQPFHYAAIEREQNSGGRLSEYELYGVYANFHPDNKILASFLPKSDMMHHRKKIIEDQNVLDSFLVPYVAYHSWISEP